MKKYKLNDLITSYDNFIKSYAFIDSSECYLMYDKYDPFICCMVDTYESYSSDHESYYTYNTIMKAFIENTYEFK